MKHRCCGCAQARARVSQATNRLFATVASAVLLTRGGAWGSPDVMNRKAPAFNLLPDFRGFRHHCVTSSISLSEGTGSTGRPIGPEGEEWSSPMDAPRRRCGRWGVLWRLYQTVLQQPRLGTPTKSALIHRARRKPVLEYTPPTDLSFITPDLGPVPVASSGIVSCIHLVTRAASSEQKSLVYVNGSEVSGNPRPSRPLPFAPQLDHPPDYTPGESDVVGLNLVGEFSIAKPAYLHIAPVRAGTTPLLWVTQFSMTRRGSVSGIDVFGKGPAEMKLGFSFNWPNEVYNLPPGTVVGASDESLIVADGFLMPGRSDGGIYVVQEPGKPNERVVRLTRHRPGWFYHKAAWVDLMGNGRPCVLTARATKPLFGTSEGELVLLVQADGPFPLAEWNTPWSEVVLVKGPDVMFDVVDLDPDDDFVEVFAAEFFSRRLTLHRVRKGDWRTGRLPKVVSSQVLDDSLGPAYSVVVADLTGQGRPSHVLVSSHECQYEGLDPSYGSQQQQQAGVTAVEGSTATDAARLRPQRRSRGWGSRAQGQRARQGHTQEQGVVKGGSLFAYRIPSEWQAQGAIWRRSVVATGFQVRTWGQINPGAPGFAYVFHPHKAMEAAGKRPYILLAGDCSHAAYIYRPVEEDSGIEGAGDDVRYELMTEINCGGTVGSIAVGYLPLFKGSGADEGWAKVFIPNFDSDKVYVFNFVPERTPGMLLSQPVSLSQRGDATQ